MGAYGAKYPVRQFISKTIVGDENKLNSMNFLEKSFFLIRKI